jgi:hypothetical protein
MTYRAILGLALAAGVAAQALAQTVAPPSQPPADQKTYSAPSWEEAVNSVPCDAFARNKDGSWSQTAVIKIGPGSSSYFGARLEGGGSGAWAVGNVRNGVLWGNTFRNTAETAILARRCG